ncbi:MAG: hypothetical protein O9340_05200 [Cyclobacteriaceae bacterium]|jgi:hypothetical protein|nr:hypothetical protein [Cyclobacteriaceae bacterium]
MDKLQFLIDWYNKEEDRKASVENSLNIPIGILTVLFAIQFYLVKDFDFVSCRNWERIFLLVFVIASALSSLATGWFIFKSYHKFPHEYKYGGIPYPTQLIKYEKELVEYYKENGSQFDNVSGESKFEEYLQNKLAEHIDKNSFNNDEKYRFLNISKRFIFLSIITIVIAFIPFLTNLLFRPPKPQQVEIINLDSLNKRIETLENILDHNLKENAKRTETIDTTTTATGQTN